MRRQVRLAEDVGQDGELGRERLSGNIRGAEMPGEAQLRNVLASTLAGEHSTQTSGERTSHLAAPTLPRWAILRVISPILVINIETSEPSSDASASG